MEALVLTPIRRMGNSQGVLIPKPFLQQIGLMDVVEIAVEGETVVLRKPKAGVRVGWAEAGRKIAAAGDDAPVLPEFTNVDDEDWAW
jgi:antitoxin MazE